MRRSLCWTWPKQKLSSLGLHAWTVEVADNRALPLPEASPIWSWPDGASPQRRLVWSALAGRQMRPGAGRDADVFLRPGAHRVIPRDAGDGRGTPQPPTRVGRLLRLAGAGARGYSSTWIRTDYRFNSLAEAVDLTGFFFGADFARQVVEQQWLIVPECTGLWWKLKD
jgi:hypothetical protein